MKKERKTPRCTTCGYKQRGKRHSQGEHHLLHEHVPGKYLPGTQTRTLTLLKEHYA